jgi:hypothetical protein
MGSSVAPIVLSGDSTSTSASLWAFRQLLTSSSGGGGGGVTQLVAGTNVTLSPAGGTGVVTVNATGGGGGAVASVSGSGTGISVTPTTGAVVVSNTQPASTWSTYTATSTVDMGNFEIQNTQGLRGSASAASLPIVAALGKDINLLPDNGTGAGFTNLFGRLSMNDNLISLRDNIDLKNFVQFDGTFDGAVIGGKSGVALVATNTGTPVPGLAVDEFANVIIPFKLFRQIVGTSNLVETPIIQHGFVFIATSPTRFDFVPNGYKDFASPPTVLATPQSVTGVDTVTISNITASGFDVYSSLIGRPASWIALGI